MGHPSPSAARSVSHINDSELNRLVRAAAMDLSNGDTLATVFIDSLTGSSASDRRDACNRLLDRVAYQLCGHAISTEEAVLNHMPSARVAFPALPAAVDKLLAVRLRQSSVVDSPKTFAEGRHLAAAPAASADAASSAPAPLAWPLCLGGLASMVTPLAARIGDHVRLCPFKTFAALSSLVLLVDLMSQPSDDLTIAAPIVLALSVAASLVTSSRTVQGTVHPLRVAEHDRAEAQRHEVCERRRAAAKAWLRRREGEWTQRLTTRVLS
jgi:hypothetical protein